MGKKKKKVQFLLYKKHIAAGQIANIFRSAIKNRDKKELKKWHHNHPT